jgi:hypothetical protein
MHCKQAAQQIAEMRRPEDATAALTQHILQCDPCRALLVERRALHIAYAQLRDETSAASPSAHVEEHVLAALNGRIHKPSHRANGRRRALAGAIAAVLIAAVLIATYRNRPSAPAQPVAVAADAPFTAMPYVVPPAPYERTAVIRTEVPLQVMLAAGFQVHGEDLGSSTKADVLFGEDGRILAIRLVSQPQNISTKRMD